MNRSSQQYMPQMSNQQKRSRGLYQQPKKMSSGQQTASRSISIKETPQLPPVIINPNYLQGKLREEIGKYMRVNFLVGTGSFIDKDGVLEEVGVDHIVLRDIKTNDKIIADLYTIKFVDIPEE